MNSAGMPPKVLFRPFLLVGIVVSLIVTALSVYLSPWGLRELRRWATEVRADLVTNIIQPGRFTRIENRPDAAHPRAAAERPVARHLHRRPARPEGSRDDPRRAGRDPQERRQRLSRARARQRAAARGRTARSDASCCSTATRSTCRSSPPGRRTSSIRCASAISGSCANPVPGDPLFADQPGQVRAEFHDRITAPLYPLAFVFVTYAYLGAPRTTRQGRTTSLLAAIGVISALRGIGFAGMIAGVQTPIALVLPYLALIAACVLGYFSISRGHHHRAAGVRHQCHQQPDRTSRPARRRSDGASADDRRNALAILRAALPHARFSPCSRARSR